MYLSMGKVELHYLNASSSPAFCFSRSVAKVVLTATGADSQISLKEKWSAKIKNK
jgi:hypothetical protein